MNSLIFDIVSLIDYNNDIFKKFNLNDNYSFDVTKLEYLKHIRQQSFHSLDNLSDNIISNDNVSNYDLSDEILSNEKIAILENLDNFSDELSENSYNNLSENWSYNSLISLESEFSSFNSIDSDLNNNSLELNNINKDLNNKNTCINNEIYNILKNDYLNFLKYYKLVDEIKYKNLKLYKNLTKKIIYINLEKIKQSFIKLLSKNNKK